MAKVQRSEDEVRGAAQEQVALLVSAARAFDSGDSLQYLNMAVRLRVLLHHNPESRSHALLHQVGILDRPIFIASGADFEPENALPSSSTLTVIRMSGSEGTALVPRFSDIAECFPRKHLPLHIQIHRMTHGIVVRSGGRGRTFDDWWSHPVIQNVERHQFSRSQLVKNVANADGGAHVDPTLTERHYALTRGNSMQMFFGDEPMESPVPAAIRQITWEVHAMLYENEPTLLALVSRTEPEQRWGEHP